MLPCCGFTMMHPHKSPLSRTKGTAARRRDLSTPVKVSRASLEAAKHHSPSMLPPGDHTGLALLTHRTETKATETDIPFISHPIGFANLVGLTTSLLTTVVGQQQRMTGAGAAMVGRVLRRRMMREGLRVLQMHRRVVKVMEGGGGGAAGRGKDAFERYVGGGWMDGGLRCSAGVFVFAGWHVFVCVCLLIACRVDLAHAVRPLSAEKEALLAAIVRSAQHGTHTHQSMGGVSEWTPPVSLVFSVCCAVCVSRPIELPSV